MVNAIKNRSTEVLQFPQFTLQPNEFRIISWDNIDNNDIGVALRYYDEQKLYFCSEDGQPVISTRTTSYVKEENGVLVEKTIEIDEVLEFLNRQVAEVIRRKNRQVL